MLVTECAVYHEELPTKGYFGHLTTKNFFVILEIDDHFPKEKGDSFLQDLAQAVLIQPVINLAAFETLVNQQINKANLPMNFSLAAAFLKHNLLFLKTYNAAEVDLRRGREMVKLIDGNNSASGYVKEDDLLVLGTIGLKKAVGDLNLIKRIIGDKKAQDAIDQLLPYLKGQEKPPVAIFVSFLEYRQPDLSVNEPSLLVQPEERPKTINAAVSFGGFIAQIKDDFFRLNNLSTNRKKVTVLLAVIVVLLLVWSVVFGYQRRQVSEEAKKITQTKELINKKMAEVDDIAYLDLSRAKTLIAEARTEVDKLAKTMSKNKEKEIQIIKEIINTEEAKVFKKEEKPANEFFDLAVEDKQAEGQALYLNGETILILDTGKKSIYQLSVAKKSLVKITDSQIASANLVAGYDQATFFLNGQGIYKTEGGKTQKVIEADKDWGKIGQIIIYGGNIYLLDKGKGTIYKYLVAESGYSTKNSYFKDGESPNLSSANAIAIDGSIYVAFDDQVIKYTSGVRDDFKFSLPETGYVINKIYTDKELEKIYAWDKKEGIVFALNKNGTYERQINSSTLKKASDFVVYSGVGYFLVDQKIYSIDLN